LSLITETYLLASKGLDTFIGLKVLKLSKNTLKSSF